MKQLLLFVAVASIQFACKKETSSVDHINAQVSSNAAVRYGNGVIFPFDEIISSDCTFEDVHITGNISFFENQVISAGGPSHYQSQLRYTNVEAIGLTTGKKYLYIGAENTIRNAADSDKLVFTIQSKFTFLRPASGVRQILAATIHVIANANGTVVVDFLEFDFSCK